MAIMLARWFLKMTGWTIDGGAPAERCYVLVGAPHTSNWDFVYFHVINTILGIKISWMGKHVLFGRPFGGFMRRLGGIPIERHQRGDVVTRMAQLFSEREDFALAIAVEGTRRPTTHWKSGFYHIARAADVPVVLGYLDYSRRHGGYGPAVHLTGDVDRDMDRIRDFFSDKLGRHPEKFGPVRLREETQGDEHHSEG